MLVTKNDHWTINVLFEASTKKSSCSGIFLYIYFFLWYCGLVRAAAYLGEFFLATAELCLLVEECLVYCNDYSNCND